MTKVPITIRVSCDLLKQLLNLPDDVDVLGIVGVDDAGGAFPVLLETPVRHLNNVNLTCEYRRTDERTEFIGFK